MTSSFRNIDSSLKKYLLKHQLPDVYEALLTGLAVMVPDDALQFIIDKLHILKQTDSDVIKWDMFVDDDMKPPRKLFQESFDFFSLDGDATPTPVMFAMAYGHYNRHIKKKHFRAWLHYHLYIKEYRRIQKEKMVYAAKYHAHAMMRRNLILWRDWVRFRKGRQQMAFNKLEHVFDQSFCRVMFKAWNEVTLDAKQTRQYFERLERGERMEEEQHEVLAGGSGEARDDISLLPRKVAAMIFRHLTMVDLARCALVCRTWKVITQTSSLFSELDLSGTKGLNDRFASKLVMKSRPYLVHLNIRGCNYLTKSTYQSISECRNLQDLNVSGCYNVTDDMIRPVLESCQILLYLNLANTTITDASLRTLATCCRNLQFLSLAHCSQFTDRGLLYLAEGAGCQKMTYLDLTACVQIEEQGYKYLAENCHKLRYLVINDLANLTDDRFMPLAASCKGLRSIVALRTPNLSDAVFKLLASYKKLEKIRIECNDRITDAALKMVAKSCNDLRHVYVVDCLRITDASLKSLSYCRNLIVLNVSDCVRITDAGVRVVLDGPAGASLREMNLTNCVRVGDMGLVNMHKRCHKLTYLSLCYCEHLSEAAIELLGHTHSLISLDISGCNCGDQALAALGNNHKFRDLSLSACVAVTDLGLQKFAQRCKDLERLDLSHCQQITDGAIKNLAFCCRMLTSLNVAGCKALTDMSIQYLSGVCHHLHTLNLSGCILLSDKSIKYLHKGCRMLRKLIILYCCGITKHTAQKMSRFVEHLQHSTEDVPSSYGY